MIPRQRYQALDYYRRHGVGSWALDAAETHEHEQLASVIGRARARMSQSVSRSKPQPARRRSGRCRGRSWSAPVSRMNVTRANHHGSALVSATPLTIKVNTATKIKRKGPQNSLAALVSGDRVQVQYRICKADFAPLTPTSFNASTTLFAKRVDAHPAHLA